MYIIFLIILAIVAYNIFNKIKAKASSVTPISSCEACVRGKRQDAEIEQNGQANITFVVAFEVGLQELEFKVKQSVYKKIPENTCGKLTYRDNRFIKFEYDGKIIF